MSIQINLETATISDTITLDDGSKYISGWTTNIFPESRGFLVKLDSEGNLLWENVYDEATLARSIALNSDGTVNLVGVGEFEINTPDGKSYINEPIDGVRDFFAYNMKINPDGSTVWLSVYDSEPKAGSSFNLDDAGVVEVLSDGSSIVYGYIGKNPDDSIEAGNSNVGVTKFNNDGEVDWVTNIEVTDRLGRDGLFDLERQIEILEDKYIVVDFRRFDPSSTTQFGDIVIAEGEVSPGFNRAIALIDTDGNFIEVVPHTDEDLIRSNLYDVFDSISEPTSIQAGVEGEDFIFSKYQTVNDNNNTSKRGFAADGDYWIKSKNGYDELIGNGQEVAFIAGSRDDVRGINGSSLSAEDVLTGLEEGSIVATKSFASYDGIYNLANFEAGSLDDLLDAGQVNVTRIDAQTGEQIGGTFILDPAQMYSQLGAEFTNSLSAQNGNDFGSIIAADPTLGLI